MSETNSSALNIFVTGAASELGLVTIQTLRRRGHNVTGQAEDSEELGKVQRAGASGVRAKLTNLAEMTQALTVAQPQIILNLAGQKANSLLHDGQNWKDYERFLPIATATLLNAARQVSPSLVIHASYAFLYGNKLAATEDTPLQIPANDPIFAAAIEAERMMAESKLPLALVRLGYLYGPQAHDLELYRLSFKLFRPYYAGPPYHRGNYVHFEDAAMALALVAEKHPSSQIFNAVDGQPASFGNFIDHFAHLLRRLPPFHIPTWSAPLATVIIKRPQIELLELTTSINAEKIQRELGWQPQYANYQAGLAQTVQAWRTKDFGR